MFIIHNEHDTNKYSYILINQMHLTIEMHTYQYELHITIINLHNCIHNTENGRKISTSCIVRNSKK